MGLKYYKHQMSSSRLYAVYSKAKSRCNNENGPNYKDYGGRGIRFKWKSFNDFYKDMFSTYEEGLTLERINNNGNYCKENCKWATMTEQANNKRNNTYLEFKGLKLTIPQWARKLGIKRSTISMRYYKYNWDIERILTTN